MHGRLGRRAAAEPGVVVTLFPPGGTAFRAARASDLRIVWSDRRAVLVALETTKPADVWRIYDNGALFAARGAMAGCLGWSRIIERTAS